MPVEPDFPVESPPADDRGSNAPFLTVSELAGRLKATVENAFDFVRVRAEISRTSVSPIAINTRCGCVVRRRRPRLCGRFSAKMSLNGTMSGPSRS